MTYKAIIFAVAFLSSYILASCSFNKLYLHPAKVPPTAKKINIKSETDTMSISFDGDFFQPTFFNTNNDTIIDDFTIESIVFKSKSGNNLNAWMIKSKNINPTATLLNFHGNAGFLISHYQSMTPLLKHGFQIFMFDYSGFGFSEGKATRKNVLSDAQSALDYIKQREDVNLEKTIIYGQSLGGHLAVVIASQNQSDIKGLVIEGAFSSHKDIAAEVAGVFGRIFVAEKYSATKAVKEYKKPILIIHSKDDEVIPFNMGKKLYENANNPKEFYEIANCHICGTDFYADKIANKIKKILSVP